jgi:hypothetical protein
MICGMPAAISRPVLPAGVCFDEGEPVLHAHFGRACAGGSQEDPANIDADTGDPPAFCPLAEHLGFAAAQVELPHPVPQPADLAEQHQLFLGERVEDAMIGFGDLMEAQRHGSSESCRKRDTLTRYTLTWYIGC